MLVRLLSLAGFVLAWLGLRLTPPWQCISALFTVDGQRDISLKKSTKTRTNFGRAGLAFAPRAFLRFFHRDVPPLTLFDVVVEGTPCGAQAGSEQNFVSALRASQSNLPEF